MTEAAPPTTTEAKGEAKAEAKAEVEREGEGKGEPAKKEKKKQASPARWEEIGGLEWSKRWAAGPWGGPPPSPAPAPQRSHQELDDARIEPWGRIWERKYMFNNEEAKCGQLTIVRSNEAVFKEYWGKLCARIPNGFEYIRVGRKLASGKRATDYFKPVEGSSICEMLLSINQHLWSTDGTTWVAPPYYDGPSPEQVLGGSAELLGHWRLQAGGREYLNFWGSSFETGGCCAEHEPVWRQELKVDVCGKAQADIANHLDIFVQKRTTPWSPKAEPSGTWGAGLPLPFVKLLEKDAFHKPPPIQMRWAVPAHKASAATPQCLDIRTSMPVFLGPPWRGALAASCCDEAGRSSRPFCEEGLLWKQAGEHCGRLGLRLCTRKELEHSLDSQGQCLFDQRLHWTSDECSGPVDCFGEPLRVGSKTVTDLSFWQEQCKSFPPGTEFVRLQMGGVVDYFKPSYGHDLCDMLTSNDKHLYSAEGVNWSPLPRGPDTILGGSLPGWPDFAEMSRGGMIVADDRLTPSVWGWVDKRDLPDQEEAPWKNRTGGCCQETRTGNKKNNTLSWGLPFTMTACKSDPGAVLGDSAKTRKEAEAQGDTEFSCHEVVPLVGASNAKRTPDFAISALVAQEAGQLENGRVQMGLSRMDSKSGGWSPKDSASFWLQWDFGRPVVVSAVRLNGRYDDHQWVRTFVLSYTEGEGENFTMIEKIFAGSPGHDTPVQRSISPPILARKIRLHTVTWHGHPSLRAEFLGCDSPRGGGLILGVECTDADCESVASCPEGQWPRSCQTEPLDSGAGAYVSSEGSCTAMNGNATTSIRARLLCGERKTFAVGKHFQEGQVLSVGCPMGIVPISCNCVAKGSLEMCGGQAEFLPLGTSCVKHVPVGSRWPQSGRIAQIFALCPTGGPVKAAPEPPPSEPRPSIASQSLAGGAHAAAERVLADDGDNLGSIWLGPPQKPSGWFILDLGREAAVGAFAIRNTVHEQVHWAENFTIEAAPEKGSWSLAAEGVLAPSLDLVHIDSAAASMRYVRFNYSSAGPMGGGLGYFAAVGPEETAELGGAITNGSKCVPPPKWCSAFNEMYSEEDCDGDGVLDPHCTNGKRLSGFLSSADGCKNSWPRGGCQGSCKRPLSWCPRGHQYTEQDCDGDGIPDPYCQKHPDDVAFLGSASGCVDNGPHGNCKTGACLKPEGWCQGDPSFEASYRDCDGDGILDYFCVERHKGRSGYVSSRNQCGSTWPYGGCGGSCRRPNGWCTQDHQAFDDSKDWDGDGIPDPSCVETRMTKELAAAGATWRWLGSTHFDDLNRSGFISSKNLCMHTRHVGGKCFVPYNWCTHMGSTYQETDCDGDGIPDALCFDDLGTSGFISSFADCIDTFPQGMCGDPLSLGKFLVSKMKCQRPGETCECSDDFCKFGLSAGLTNRTDVDGDGLMDLHIKIQHPGVDLEVCGTIASSRRCLGSFPNCLRSKSFFMRSLVWYKELECELWEPAEIAFLMFTFVACLFAYGICECPSRTRKLT